MMCTVRPLHKEHTGTSHFVHFREVAHSSKGEMYQHCSIVYFGATESVLCREVMFRCPLLGVSFKKGSTVYVACI